MPIANRQSGETCYAFGDSEIAARRLELLARVFAGSTRAFLNRVVSRQAGLAIDLGCGPGHSTQFLAGLLRHDQLVGIDNSERFIAMAQCRATERVSFLLHDFTVVPFPVGPADLLYARFELSHLPQPRAIVERWAAQLRPGGLLLLEETEWIRTDNPAFALYLQIVEAMLAHQSTQLYVGPTLDELPDTEFLKRRASDVGRLSVHRQDAAAMFYLNIQTWKQNPFIRENYPASRIAQLEGELGSLTQLPGHMNEIEWGLRQIAFDRI